MVKVFRLLMGWTVLINACSVRLWMAVYSGKRAAILGVTFGLFYPLVIYSALLLPDVWYNFSVSGVKGTAEINHKEAREAHAGPVWIFMIGVCCGLSLELGSGFVCFAMPC